MRCLPRARPVAGTGRVLNGQPSCPNMQGFFVRARLDRPWLKWPWPVAGTGRGCQGHGSCHFLHVGTRLDSVGELALEEAVLIDLAVDRARLDELVMRAARGDAATVEDDDL